MVRGVALWCAVVLLLAPLAAAAAPDDPTGTRAPAIPRIQNVGDPRGDVRAQGAPAAVRRSVDVTELRVRRDFKQMHVRFRVADLRGSRGWQQRTAVVLTSPRIPRQVWTATGSTLRKGDPDTGRVCGSSFRRPRADVVVVRIPFSCIRITAGKLLGLHGVTSASRGGDEARDRTRSVRTDPR